jgi:hypothetical protein
MRWNIEDFFWAVKSEDLNYESSESESDKVLCKLFIMALPAAIRILQLCQARSGETGQKMPSVFSEEQRVCRTTCRLVLKGKTAKLKNPYDRDNLAWRTWMIARMGNWKSYAG